MGIQSPRIELHPFTNDRYALFVDQVGRDFERLLDRLEARIEPHGPLVATGRRLQSQVRWPVTFQLKA